MRVLSLRPAIAALLVFASVSVPAFAPALADPAPTGADTPQTEIQRDAAQAAASGERVEVTSRETADSTTYVNPDGTLTTDQSVAPIRVKQPDGSWQPVDYTLEHVDGGWQPKMSPVPVVFSDGADADAAAIGSGSKQVQLSWAVTLPAPTIDGSEARYALGGGETLVLNATATGFEQSLELAQAPASLPQIKLPLDDAALTTTATGDGGLRFTNAAGDVVYSMPAPMMYDSATDPDGEATAPPVSVSTTLTATADGPRLDLSPSLAWLQSPDRVYPVTIDPSINSNTNASDSFIEDDITTSQVSNLQMRAGEYLDSATNTNHAARSLLRFASVDQLAGATIQSAKLTLWNNKVRACDSSNQNYSTIYAYPLMSSFSASTTWSTRPTFSTSATTSGSVVATGCALGAVSIDVSKMVSAWTAASSPTTNNGLQLSGHEAAGAQYWWFCSFNYDTSSNTSCNQSGHAPSLSITYNMPPSPVGDSTLCVTPNTETCQLGQMTIATSLTPTLSAVATDGNGDSLNYTFEVWSENSDHSQVSLLSTGTSGYVTSGTAAKWNVTSALPIATVVDYRVRAYDGTDFGEWSTWYPFYTVDSSDATTSSSDADTDPAPPPAADTGTVDVENEPAIDAADNEEVDSPEVTDTDSAVTQNVATQTCQEPSYVSGAVDNETSMGVDADNANDDEVQYYPTDCSSVKADAVNADAQKAEAEMVGANAKSKSVIASVVEPGTCPSPHGRLKGQDISRYTWCGAGNLKFTTSIYYDGEKKTGTVTMFWETWMVVNRKKREIWAYAFTTGYQTEGDSRIVAILLRDDIEVDLSAKGFPSADQCEMMSSSHTIPYAYHSAQDWSFGQYGRFAYWHMQSAKGTSEHDGGHNNDSRTAPYLGSCGLSWTFKDRSGVPSAPPGVLHHYVRCDSASYLPGPGGCVNSDKTAVLTYNAQSGSNQYAAARHIGYACTHEASTSPYSPSKHIPGCNKSSLISRLTGDVNRSAIVAVCKADDPNYASKGLDCDEFPFASTDQHGTSTNKNFSALAINRSQNRSAGAVLRYWYADNRILDYGVGSKALDQFYVHISNY